MSSNISQVIERTLTCIRVGGERLVRIEADDVQEFKAYFREIRSPYRAGASSGELHEFRFPIDWKNLEETLLFFFDGIYDVIEGVDET